MAVSLKHSFTSGKADGPDATLVQPSNWNAEHVLTQATGRLLGRTSSGAGATEEIAVGTGLTLAGGTLAADVDTSSLVPNTRTLTTTNGIAGGGNLTADREFALTGQALAVHNLSSNGLITRTASGTVAARSIEGTANQITVTNGNGMAGDPAVAAVIASQAVAEAGTDNVSLMSSLRTKQAINAVVGAIVEGAAGAPKVRGVALGHRVQTEISASGTSWATITGLSDIRALTFVVSLDGDTNTSLIVSFSTNNGSSWTAAVTVGRKPSGGAAGFSCFVDLDRGLAVAAGGSAGFRVKFADATYNAVRFRSSDSSDGGVQVVPIIAQGRPT